MSSRFLQFRRWKKRIDLETSFAYGGVLMTNLICLLAEIKSSRNRKETFLYDFLDKVIKNSCQKYKHLFPINPFAAGNTPVCG